MPFLRLDQSIDDRCHHRSGDKVLWWRGEWWSGGAFLGLVDQCTEALTKSGFSSGQRLALLLPNSPVFLALCVATWRLKGTVAPLNPLAGSRAVLQALEFARPFAVVVPQETSEDVKKNLRTVTSVLVSPLEGPISAEPGISHTLETPETAVLFFTSGTTGTPKSVPLTHANILDNVAGTLQHLEGLREGETLLNVLPNFHAFGFTVCSMLPLVGGLAQVIMPTFMPAENTLNALLASEASVVVGVPTMIALLLGAAARGGVQCPSVKMIVSGGDRFPVHLDGRCQEVFGVGVLEGYGLTETSPVVSINPAAHNRRLGTVGSLLPGFEAQVRNAAGEILAPGDEGVLWLRGPSVTSGYFDAPDLTAQRFDGGWFNTGDMVRLDADGYLSILERVSDLIIVSGFNVFPQDVESVLRTHPGVRDIAVVGVPHAVSGEIVQAFVVPNPEVPVTVRELAAFCRDRLAHYKIPRSWAFVDEFPRSSIGKVLRHELRRRGISSPQE
mgnify:CR=1 FL=1